MGNNFRKIMVVRGESIARPEEANNCSCLSDNVEKPRVDWPEQPEAKNFVQSFTIDEESFDKSVQPTSCLCVKYGTEPRDCIACGAERRLRELLESSKDEEATKLSQPSGRRSSSITTEVAGEYPHSANVTTESREESEKGLSTSLEKKKKIKGLYERLKGLKSFCISGNCMERRRRTTRCACSRAGIYTYVIQS